MARTGSDLDRMDDLEIAGFCNTEGWPEPECYSTVLAAVWALEIDQKLYEEGRR